MSEQYANNSISYQDGILYAEYNGHVTTDAMLDLINRAIVLVADRHITVTPIVIIFSESAYMSDVSITHMSKLINTELVKHLSAIIVVGMRHINVNFVNSVSRFFLGNRVHACETIAEARKVAETYRSETRPLLEQ
jgi:hypothetical protein